MPRGANHAQDAVRRPAPFDAAGNPRPAELPVREEFEFRHQPRRVAIPSQPGLRFHHVQQGNFRLRWYRSSRRTAGVSPPIRGVKSIGISTRL